MMNTTNCGTTLRRLFPNAIWLKPEIVDSTHVEKCRLHFEKWRGAPISRELRRRYGNKGIVICGGQGAYAELAILQLLRNAGFDGRWVDNYGGSVKFWKEPWSHDDLRDLPDSARRVYLKIIEAHDGRRGGFWDVIAWKGDQYVFAESKQRKRGYRDRLSPKQRKWLKAAESVQETGAGCFVICEWDLQ